MKQIELIIQRDEFQTSLSDIIGLERVKEKVKQLVDDENSFPKCALVYGPPGSGKTALIKAFCAEPRLNPFFLNVANLTFYGHELVDRLFQLAESNQPSFVILDDLETLFLSREQFADVISTIQSSIQSEN